MRAFAQLYRALDSATSSRHKIEAMAAYFRAADDPASAAWIVYLLSGGKRRQAAPSRLLRRLAAEATGLPDWLIEESYQSVGDLAETLALLLPPPESAEPIRLAVWLDELLPGLRLLEEEARLQRLKAYAASVAEEERLVFFKLITGALRVGVARGQVTQALSAACGVAPSILAERLVGYAQADRRVTAADFLALTAPEETGRAPSRPYPFFLAHALDVAPESLGPVESWVAEWKFDGVRAQMLRRGEGWLLWSRGEELMIEAFPDLAEIARALPEGTALDGEVVATGEGGAVAPFAALQKRLNRKAPGAKLQAEAPAAFIAYDLLEDAGRDVRPLPLLARRARLAQIVEGVGGRLRLSERLTAPDWAGLAALRAQAREIGAEGLMLKGAASPYGAGRKRSGPGEGDLWWKWKLAPMSVDAVLIYAQRGHGRRAGLYSDYTFAVWSEPGGVLTPFAKAYSGLTDAEMAQVDAIIRRTTVESFGPVRSVQPTLVFELGFEGVSLSTRHKCGVAVRFPRMLRWRKDKPVAEADTLADLKRLL